MEWHFKADYQREAFAKTTILDDELFAAIAHTWWKQPQDDKKYGDRVEVYESANDKRTVDILGADLIREGDQGDYTCPCGKRIATGGIVWVIPGVTVDDVADADLQPFCKPSCALPYDGEYLTPEMKARLDQAITTIVHLHDDEPLTAEDAFDFVSDQWPYEDWPQSMPVYFRDAYNRILTPEVTK